MFSLKQNFLKVILGLAVIFSFVGCGEYGNSGFYKFTYTITPSAGPGGSISPNTVQAISPGGSLTFTATPNAGYVVNTWFVDGIAVQTGGNSYTLSNITSNHTINVTFVLYNGPVLTVAGQDSNGTQPPLLVQSTNGGTSWSIPSTNSSALPGLTTHGIFYGNACTGIGAAAICTEVGQDLTNVNGSTPPLLVQSINGGTSWTIPSLGLLTTNGTFYGSSCTGNGANAICIAAGQYLPAPGPHLPSLLVETTNGGTTWSMVPNLFSSGFLNAPSCTGSGSTGICIAVGQNYDTANPVIVLSTNGAISWTVLATSSSIPNLPNNAYYYGSACTGSGSNAVCTAVGHDNTHTNPLLVVSNTGANSWNFIPSSSISGFTSTDNGIFNVSSCVGSGSTAICIAAGQDNTTNAPLFAQSVNGGGNWAIVPIAGLTTNGVFYGTSCTTSGQNVVCTAVGQNKATNAPLLVLGTGTLTGGMSWTNIPYTSIAGLTSNGFFNTSGCATNILTGAIICTLAGQDNTTGAPLLVQTTNGGTSWTIPSTNPAVLPGLTTKGFFNSSAQGF